MANDILVTVQQEDPFAQVVVQEQDTFNVYTSILNPATVESIGDIGDVDATGRENGSVLVYQTSSSKWTATRLLNQQVMDAGEF